jgi:hypothetical protein
LGVKEASNRTSSGHMTNHIGFSLKKGTCWAIKTKIEELGENTLCPSKIIIINTKNLHLVYFDTFVVNDICIN